MKPDIRYDPNFWIIMYFYPCELAGVWEERWNARTSEDSIYTQTSTGEETIFSSSFLHEIQYAYNLFIVFKDNYF